MIRSNHPNIILHIDHNQAKLYHLKPEGDYEVQEITPENMPEDRPPSFKRKFSILPTRSAQKSRGTKTPRGQINPQYYSEIAHAIRNAPSVIVLSRGKGKSNAANYLMKHLKAHHAEILPRIIENKTINRPTTNQMIAESRLAFERHENNVNIAKFST
ncbi:hypothetical protein KS4_32950 [Poriferisphaera corsica]|uniref:Uncharacterized protein n=1 Tax=Poriferisphaera corsica TaxID=2528020 RepID=A0A517YYC2_9BACT|nr:hypothetical protein [Poriferisphaera corsica]QDU35215.1 hypothetical protein KS4_32950 [Poriferisphaera corsica]